MLQSWYFQQPESFQVKIIVRSYMLRIFGQTSALFGLAEAEKYINDFENTYKSFDKYM